jgi:hypothetical protein
MYKRGYQRHFPDLNTKPLAPERLERALHGEALRNPTAPLSAGAIEAKALMEKAKSLLKGETSMPDFNTALRTALDKNNVQAKHESLKNTLDEWDKDDQQSTQPKESMKKKFGITNNVTRVTFDYVKNNPGLTAADVTAALVKQGFRASSVASIVSQLVFVGLCRKDDKRRVYCVANEFKSFSIATARRKAKAQAVVKAPEPTAKRIINITRRKREEAPAGLAALPVASSPVISSPVVAREGGFDPDNILRTMNVVDARRLYEALKAMFGG